jgi:hypothetical protein
VSTITYSESPKHPDNFEYWFKLQGGKCAFCHRTLRPNRKESVLDHDHATDRIRGLVHHTCNVAVGGVENALKLVDWDWIKFYMNLGKRTDPRSATYRFLTEHRE